MDNFPAPLPPAAAAPMFVGGGSRYAEDEEIPLGWECANPALQIECWGTDEAGAAAVGLVSEL